MSFRRIEVTAAVLVREGLVLAAQRPPGTQQGGLWEFPGGKLKPGETAEQALQRELREELGIDVVVGPRLYDCVHDYAELQLQVHLQFYRIEHFTGELVRHEHQALRWVPASELHQLSFLAADEAFIRDVSAGLVSIA